jgi:hypothetical protein
LYKKYKWLLDFDVKRVRNFSEVSYSFPKKKTVETEDEIA